MPLLSDQPIINTFPLIFLAFAHLSCGSSDDPEPTSNDSASNDPDGTNDDPAGDPNDDGSSTDDCPSVPIPPEGEGAGAIVTQEVFDQLFPHRTDENCTATQPGATTIYTYESFLEAAARFPKFLTEGTEDDRRREAAAFFANVAQETTGGWADAPDGPQAWGLCFAEELGCEDDACVGRFCLDPNFPCNDEKSYHGRGPIQLTYNYNYSQAGEALERDLINDPDQVARDGVAAFETALWFWMTPQSPKPSAHSIFSGDYAPTAADEAAQRLPGFGLTINIINGGIECGKAAEKADGRIAHFRRFVTILGTSEGDNVECVSQQPWVG